MTKNNKTRSGCAAFGALPAITAGLLTVGALTAQASSDYGPAIWRPACSGHWNTSGNGHKFLVIHDMEGYYAYEVSTSGGLRSCSTTVSVHYGVNGKKDASSDYAAGEVTQFVSEAYYAWHARCWNGSSAGTEHEGFRSNPAWYTPELYYNSALLQRHMADHYGIAKDRNHIVGHDAKSSGAWVSYANANLGINASCNTHDDPGPYWDWTGFMNLINSTTGSSQRTPYNAIGRNTDGRQEIFMVADNGAASHSWQGGANGTFGGWNAVGGALLPGCIVAKNADGHLESFAIGTNNAVWHNWGPSWTSWQSLGGSSKQIAVGSNPDGRVEVFSIGSDNLVYHLWQTSPNSAFTTTWAALNTSTVQISSITVLPNSDGHLELFAIGVDGVPRHAWAANVTGGWTGWENFGGTAKKLTAAMNPDGRLELLEIGSDNLIYHQWQSVPNGAFTGNWVRLNADNLQFTNLTVAANADGHLEVFGLATNNVTWHAWAANVAGGWTTFASLGGWSSSIAVGANADGHLELFGVGTDRQLYHMWQGSPNGGFGGWNAMGGAWRGL